MDWHTFWDRLGMGFGGIMVLTLIIIAAGILYHIVITLQYYSLLVFPIVGIFYLIGYIIDKHM